MNQLLRLINALDFPEEGLKSLRLNLWKSGMKERLDDKSLQYITAHCTNLNKLIVTNMGKNWYRSDLPSAIMREQLLNLTESIIRSSSGQLKHLDLYRITDESPLSEHDESLISALVQSQINQLEYFNMNYNP